MKKKKKRTYKRFIQIKSRKNGWTKVELLSINKGGTVTIRFIDGNIVKRKHNKIRWSDVKKVEGNKIYPATINPKDRKRKKKKRNNRDKENKMQSLFNERIKKLDSKGD